MKTLDKEGIIDGVRFLKVGEGVTLSRGRQALQQEGDDKEMQVKTEQHIGYQEKAGILRQWRRLALYSWRCERDVGSGATVHSR